VSEAFNTERERLLLFCRLALGPGVWIHFAPRSASRRREWRLAFIATGTRIATVADPKGFFADALAFNQNGSELAVADADGSTLVWQVSR
jgi:hypothetical protein